MVIKMEGSCPELAGDQVKGVRNAFALMATCRQSRQECLHTLSAVNKFVLDAGMLDYIKSDNEMPEEVEQGYQQRAKTSAWLMRG